ncbi:MAG TPA: hypothetical protein VMT16_10810 [Thermoanaerobaculia bacterium]|nr:hypothetical protein [Thermoanaerobaculia bacterium]
MLVFLLAAPLAPPASFASSPDAAAGAPGVQLVALVELPSSLAGARDVRWDGERALLIATAEEGIQRLDLRHDPPRMLPLVRPSSEGGPWLPTRLAASSRWLAFASPVRQAAWSAREGAAEFEVSGHGLEFVEDVDLDDDRLLLLGTRRDEDRRYAPDGAIAWLLPLANGTDELQPVHFSSAGPGAEPMDHCGAFQIGAVRFLADGGFVIVPGAEPGVFRYDRKGRLARTWSTDPLGVDPSCRMSDEERKRHRHDPARFAWINRRPVVDEVIPWGTDFAAIVRRPGADGPRWQLAVFEGERISVSALPLAVPEPNARVKADTRGDQIALLVVDPSRPPGPPPKPRLALLRIVR